MPTKHGFRTPEDDISSQRGAALRYADTLDALRSEDVQEIVSEFADVAGLEVQESDSGWRIVDSDGSLLMTITPHHRLTDQIFIEGTNWRSQDTNEIQLVRTLFEATGLVTTYWHEKTVSKMSGDTQKYVDAYTFPYPPHGPSS